MTENNDIRDQITAALRTVFDGAKMTRFTDSGREIALAQLRALPWERDEGGLFMRYELDGGTKVEDRWDGESLEIKRAVTLPANVDRVMVNLTFDDEGR